MSLVDEIFGEQQFPESTETKEKAIQEETNTSSAFSKEEWADQKKLDREIAFEMVDRTAEVSVSSPAEWKKFLNVMSRFDRYSVSNLLLITAQRPDAVRIGSFDQWKSAGGNIKKGQKGLLIVEPGGQYQREDGSTGTYYNAKRVFDIAQTSLTLPAAKTEYTPRTVIRALLKKTPVRIVPCEVDDMPPGRGALYAPKEECIFVRKHMNENDTFKALSIELCHAIFADGNKEYSRLGNVFPAYCVSYVLCQKYGLDNREYDFKRVPEMFRDTESAQIRDMLGTIRGAVVHLIDSMTKALVQEQASPTPKTQTTPTR